MLLARLHRAPAGLPPAAHGVALTSRDSSARRASFHVLTDCSCLLFGEMFIENLCLSLYLGYLCFVVEF